MQSAQNTQLILPSPSQWGIDAAVGERPLVSGILVMNSVTGNQVNGTINFRGTFIPIRGYWNESTKQIRFDSPYAAYSGQLSIFDNPSIGVRHFVLNGMLIMKPPSLQAGEHGTWIATTNTALTGPPMSTSALPPVGAFLTSNFLYGSGR
ncbi:hypothetical protein [Pseudobacillus wudalianchiensis]|uniref:Uncharacterized protein n=1 Tax=Pseudobacillus wudalianchiensis TaxID=1743143 RepID=A0A1B9B828_9BACI|nr:hypothetical protein [Bacillus wudalianchiensis]OCA92233.1 hypothetical protein A8F95_00450 [Bacillus wudalianchiensis]